jgi:hypothetical protein
LEELLCIPNAGLSDLICGWQDNPHQQKSKVDHKTGNQAIKLECVRRGGCPPNRGADQHCCADASDTSSKLTEAIQIAVVPGASHGSELIDGCPYRVVRCNAVGIFRLSIRQSNPSNCFKRLPPDIPLQWVFARLSQS